MKANVKQSMTTHAKINMKINCLSRALVTLLASFVLLPLAQAKLNVVATTPDLAALAEAVGGTNITVDTIARGTQDPHQIEPKPSYMVKVSHADLLISNGLALEIGWLPSLVQGARNPKVNNGALGYLDLGSTIEPIEKPKGGASRAGGDVHPDGNPHFTLNPIRMAKLAEVVAARLSTMDAAHKDQYAANAKTYSDHLTEAVKGWQARINKTGIKKVITYHTTLNYFLDRFGIVSAGSIEPKPGIPPTVSHILEIVDLINREKIPLVLHENLYESSYFEKLKGQAPNVKIETIGAFVGSTPALKTNFDVYEGLVKAFEAAK